MLFPVLGLGSLALLPSLPQSIQIGVLFVCVLPSTVQSSVALTSIARGSVAGAICAATASNIVGIVLSPMMLAFLLQLHGESIALDGLWKNLLQLLAPFAAGHALRPWIGEWADRNRAILALTDRGSILIVIYTAFSAAVMNGVWRQLPPLVLVEVCLVNALLLAAALLAIKLGGRLLALPRGDGIAMIFCGSQKIFRDWGADGATVVFRPGCRGHRGPNNNIPSAPAAGRRLAGSSVYRDRIPSGNRREHDCCGQGFLCEAN